MMMYKTTTDARKTTIESASFCPKTGVKEWHIMLHPSPELNFEEQLRAVCEAYLHHKASALPESCTALFARCFMSDITNQARPAEKALHELFAGEGNAETALSLVGQPPLNGSKIALWVYLSTPRSEAYTHYFSASRRKSGGDSEAQTHQLFEEYEQELAAKGCSIELNCLRTWLFVRDVDVNYAGVVKGRRENFLTQGMNPQTHFIASTGIQGQSPRADEKVMMDAYAIKGLKREQVQYLYAKTHLNPTYEYNVTFERGVSMLYGDRRHVLISGTASIDNRGEILFPGDIRRQTQRMWENVGALLSEAGCTFDDVAHMIVYLRDPADYRHVQALYEERFPATPKVLLLAPVCRPGWLIEMECMAVKGEAHPEFPAL